MELRDFHAAQGSSRIIIAGDHPFLRSAIRHTLKVHPDLKVVAEAANGQEAVELCHRLRPELVLMDLMPLMDGLVATRAIRRELPDTILLISSTIDESACLSDSLKAGAAGYVLKDTSCDARRTESSGFPPHL